MSKKKPSTNSSPPKSKQPLSAGNLTPSLNESNDNRLKRNANGGILVTTEEIRNAFEFLDVDQSGKISLANLKSKLGIFFPEMTAKEYRFLMNNKREITIDDLCDILLENEITNFDPIAEAFKAYDTTGEGYISSHRLKEVFSFLGFGELTSEEMIVLNKAGDLDGDGKITLEDFRNMIENSKTDQPMPAGLHPISHTSNSQSNARGAGGNQEREHHRRSEI